MRYYILSPDARTEYDALDVTIPVNVLAGRAAIPSITPSQMTPGMCDRCKRGGRLKPFCQVPAWVFAVRRVLDAGIANNGDLLKFQYKVISENMSVFKEFNSPENRAMACDFCRSKEQAPSDAVDELRQRGAFFSLDEVRQELKRRQGLTK